MLINNYMSNLSCYLLFSPQQSYRKTYNGYQIIEKKNIKIIYVQDAFAMQEDHLKCTVAQTKVH